MSRGTSEAFFDVVEWAAEQPWSSGKVGLLGISYYAGSQWRVAARKPKGLAAMIPWEGMSDYYRDRCRQYVMMLKMFPLILLLLLLKWRYLLKCFHQVLVEQASHHESIWSARPVKSQLGTRYIRR